MHIYLRLPVKTTVLPRAESATLYTVRSYHLVG